MFFLIVFTTKTRVFNLNNTFICK